MGDSCEYDGLIPEESVGWLNNKPDPLPKLPGCVSGRSTSASISASLWRCRLVPRDKVLTECGDAPKFRRTPFGAQAASRVVSLYREARWQ